MPMITIVRGKFSVFEPSVPKVGRKAGFIFIKKGKRIRIVCIGVLFSVTCMQSISEFVLICLATGFCQALLMGI